MAAPERVQAPCCGRMVWSDILRKGQHLPAGLRKHIRGAAVFCDACEGRLVLTGVVSRADLYQAMGASKTRVERIRAKERKTQQRLAAAEPWRDDPGQR